MSDYYSILRDEIQAILPARIGTLMDIGCGAGVTANWVKKKFDCRTIGIEIDEKSASQAETCLDSVHCTNIDNDTSVYSGYQRQIDVVLMLDILEHLIDPWEQLNNIKPMLSEDGVIIASIPNVRNLKVLGPLLLKGEWTYRHSGILDRTHLRFFTRKTVIELFENAGFQVDIILTTGPTRWQQIKSKSGYLVYLLNLLFVGQLQGFISHQYIVRASLKKS